ncbi:MAG: hypothetical protein V4757_05590 [Pseudomonadota bacterium]
MNLQELAAEIGRLASTPGVIACSLIDGPTGMIYHTSGDQDLEPLAEAARDYWQLHRRQASAHQKLGEFIGLVTLHEKGVINVLQCTEDTILVTIAERNRVSFSTWPSQLDRLRQLIDDIEFHA